MLEHWLSRAGFHTSRADAEGIDILAVHKANPATLAFSMKTRFYPTFRRAGVLHKSNLEKVYASCSVWRASPWVAVYVESPSTGMLIAMPLHLYLQSYVYPDSTYYMLDIRPEPLQKLRSDPGVKIVDFGLTVAWF